MKIMYVIFVGAVLLISGLAHATTSLPFGREEATYQTPIHIRHVELDAQHMQLTINGILPNPCFQAPSASLTVDTEDPSVLILRLTSPYPQVDACMAVVKKYEAVVDLPTLARVSQLQLEDKGLYTIKTDGYEFTMKVVGSDLN